MPPNNAFASQILPPRSSASVLLTKGVTRLEGTLKLTTAILALAAGVYTFLGVRELLNGSPGMVLFAAAIYSVAVSVATRAASLAAPLAHSAVVSVAQWAASIKATTSFILPHSLWSAILMCRIST